MRKFKIGDKVRTSHGQSKEATVRTVEEDGYKLTYFDGHVGHAVWIDDELALLTPSVPSPIVTETVTRIEPGVYGIVFIADNGDIRLVTSKSPDELRAAASTFLDLVDHYESQKP